MRASWRIAISTLLAKALRSGLLIAAVSLSTAMVVCVSSGIDTVSASLRKAMSDMLGRSDLTLRHATGERLDESLAGEIAAWPEVSEVAARVTAAVRVIDERTGLDAVVTGQGVDFAAEASIHPPTMLEGRWPTGAGEASLDPRTRDLLQARIGDRLLIGDPGNEQRVTVVGINQRVVFSILQQPEIRLARPVVQTAGHATGLITTASIVLSDRESGFEVARRYAGLLPGGAVLEPSTMAISGLEKNLRAGDLAFYLTACFASLAAGFIVLTGMTTALTERIREFGMLRAIGATGKQLFGAQLFTGSIVGVIGGALGLPLGWWFAMLLYRFVIVQVVRVPMQLTSAGVATAFSGALCAGILGGLMPAFAAMRVSPLQALAARAQVPRRASVVGISLSGLVCVGIVLSVLRGPWDAQFAAWGYVSVGVPLMVVGWFLLAVPLTLLVSSLLGPGVEVLCRLPKGLVTGAVFATPFRHGFTAGGLMLGFGVLIGPAGAGRGILGDWVEQIRFPDAFVMSWTGLDKADLAWFAGQEVFSNPCPIGLFGIRARMADLPSVDSAGSPDAPLFGLAGMAPERVSYVSFEPNAFFAMTNIQWVQGDANEALRRLNEGGAILVAREFLTARAIGVGSKVILGPKDNEHEFEVVGVVASPGLDIATSFFGMQGEFYDQAIHCVFGSRADAIRCFGNERITLIQFEISGQVSDEEAEALVVKELGAVKFGTGRSITRFIDEIATRIIMLMQSIGLFGLAVASIGMANVMAANVSARRTEFGVLRSIGAGRWVVARLVLAEASLIGLSACAAGTLLGMHGASNAAHLYRILLGIGSVPEIPVDTISYGCCIVLFLCVLSCTPAVLGLLRQTPREMMDSASGA